MSIVRSMDAAVEGGKQIWELAGKEKNGGIISVSRISAVGRFFQLGQAKWYVKGLTYGSFAPNDDGEFLPPRHRVTRDFAHLRELGANALRMYYSPPLWLLDEAVAHGLRVFVDVPWQKHRCFFEDWSARQDALTRVRRTAREVGNHPATFALSVANEIPTDIARFYGARRVGRFISDLLDAAKQEAPDCLATYTNYPSTEFLETPEADFLCFNVYLNEPEKLGPYLDRLQHLAGARPLILGEFGLDSMRHGCDAQAAALATHVRAVFRHGLAGSFVFSYTDDWFTGGHRIENWAFGITDRDRNEKPAAVALRRVWSAVPKAGVCATPKVSVVVCSYNGAATLEACLRSLQSLDYPNYEVILVDDGSKDRTPEIAARFPGIRYIRQENRGLSVARNVGAEAATGSIVAYTDSDCVADDKWLHYLISAMLDQKVDAIGGPNVPPPEDGWIAQCVAASPGGPSHVMLDDRHAEHVPGCNMAFDRRKLLEIGGFDPQFRQAGDDVDICWRFLDAGYTIGYAPAALVWHHRRATVRAYLRQQKGYGRSEAMVYLKHPARFNAAGQARWNGVIYGDGSVGLPLAEPKTWHGRFGSGLFQIVYRGNDYSAWAVCSLLEWHLLAAFMIGSAVAWRPLAAVGALMAGLSLVAAARGARAASLPKGAPWWCRPLVFGLHLVQPILRAWHRHAYRLTHGRVPQLPMDDHTYRQHVKPISFGQFDLYWRSVEGRGREHLLVETVVAARAAGWSGDFRQEWQNWDACLLGGAWHHVQIRTASEELGGPKRFTRARCELQPTGFAWSIIGVVAALNTVAAISHSRIAMAMAMVLALAAFTWFFVSRRRCIRATAALLWRAAAQAALEPVRLAPASPEKVPALESVPVPEEEPAEAYIS